MSSQSKFAVKAIDHVVLYVSSIESTVRFYTDLLGMKHEEFNSTKNPDDARHALTFGNQKINLHNVAAPWEPHARRPVNGSADLCFITDTPIEEVLAQLRAAAVEILEGDQIVDRTGAVGKLRSVYIYDPDGNLIDSL